MTQAPPKRFRHVAATSWSATGPLIAVIASAVALAFTLRPSLAPDPGAGRVASVAIQTVEPGVSLGDFQAQFTRTALTKADKLAAQDKGDIVWVRVDVKGEKHGTVSLYTVPYFTTTNRVTSLADVRAQTDSNARGFNPGTPDDQWIAPLWVPNPGERYFVRVMLEHNHVILAYADTAPIPAQQQ